MLFTDQELEHHLEHVARGDTVNGVSAGKRIKADGGGDEAEESDQPIMSLRGNSDIEISDISQERDEQQGTEKSDENLPRHLQKMVDDFCIERQLYDRTGPCCSGINAPVMKANAQGKPIAFIHGRTGEVLEARMCRVRASNFALVVYG
jgi:hypothetical protein